MLSPSLPIHLRRPISVINTVPPFAAMPHLDILLRDGALVGNDHPTRSARRVTPLQSSHSQAVLAHDRL